MSRHDMESAGGIMALQNALSPDVRVLWAKTSQKFGREGADDDLWLPLFVHMSDAAAVAELLFDTWLPENTKRIVQGDGMLAGRKRLIFLAAAHDIGKATPVFQMKNEALAVRVLKYFRFRSEANMSDVSHALAGHVFLQGYLERQGGDYKVARANAVVVGGHHGLPPKAVDIQKIEDGSCREALGDVVGDKSYEKWQEAGDELLAYARKLAGLTEDEFSLLLTEKIPATMQVILSGIVMMSDWIASSFDLVPTSCFCGVDSRQRAKDMLEFLRIHRGWDVRLPDVPFDDLFIRRFQLPQGARLRPIQRKVMEVAGNASDPGLMIIEAPMGEGKTEAALGAAELLAAKCGLRGVFIALPTQATTDGIFDRILHWVNSLPGSEQKSVQLAHGKANLNDSFSGIRLRSVDVNGDEKNENAFVNDWMQGRKKGMLADIVVGTIDQVLMGALKSKHLAFRHLGLSNKVVVIDECHAYDFYMSSYLKKIILWLAGYGVPVVVLSATLPASTREALVSQYMKGLKQAGRMKKAGDLPETGEGASEVPDGRTDRAYPLITLLDGGLVRTVPVEASGRQNQICLDLITDEELSPVLAERTKEGGCVGIIRNTVARAQETAQLLVDAFGAANVKLIHSKFIGLDRVSIEKEIRRILGPAGDRPQGNGRVFVIGTQVLEQSLDIDFDLLVSDICPIDLLIQRMGRLHRHEREWRPAPLSAPKVLIAGACAGAGLPTFHSGSTSIYGDYHLYNTLSLLERNQYSIQLPADISELVQDGYSAEGLAVPESWVAAYAKAKAADGEKKALKERKAKIFQIAKPGETLVNWFGGGEHMDTDVKAEATVRDMEDTLEVIVVQRDEEGCIRMLPWVESFGGAVIPVDQAPEEELARVMAACTLTLPAGMSQEYNMDNTIKALELTGGFASWQRSHWLAESLVLVLDENLSALVNGFSLLYDPFMGLRAISIEEGESE